jgi:hypothetical protein
MNATAREINASTCKASCFALITTVVASRIVKSTRAHHRRAHHRRLSPQLDQQRRSDVFKHSTMSHVFTPILPKVSGDGSRSQSLPAILSPPPTISPLYVSEPMPNSSMQAKTELDSESKLFQEPLLMENGFSTQAAFCDEPCAIEPDAIRPDGNGNATLPLWPPEVRSLSDTNWLLPAYSDHSSSIASVLRTEIQSHNITREMLHSTEQRRLEGAQRCKQLQADLQLWMTSYTTLTTTLARYSEEFSRLSTENVALKTKMQCVPVSAVETTIENEQEPANENPRPANYWTSPDRLHTSVNFQTILTGVQTSLLVQLGLSIPRKLQCITQTTFNHRIHRSSPCHRFLQKYR